MFAQGRFFRNAQRLQPDLRPGRIGGAAARRADAGEPGRAKFAELRVSLRLDPRDAFENALKEDAVILRAWFKARRQCGVIHRETLAGLWQRVVIEARRMIGVEQRREACQIVFREVFADGRTASVRGSACQPLVTNAVAVDAEMWRKHRCVGQQLQGERGAERGDAIARRRRTAGEEGRAAIGGPGDNRCIGGKAKPGCHARADGGDPRSGRNNAGEEGGTETGFPDPAGPLAGNRIIARFQGVIFIRHVIDARQPAQNPVRLMDDPPALAHKFHGAGERRGGAQRRRFTRGGSCNACEMVSFAHVIIH